MEQALGQRQYRLLQKIATGGMAEVFLAQLEGPGGFERRVVVKKVLRRWAHNRDVLSLFRDEARIGSRLDHHNVVQVLDYGRSGEDTYLVLEYVEGRNLAELIGAAVDRGHYLASTIVSYVASECCSALDHIHRRTDRTGEHLGVVHRDINPANILLSHSGEVKLTDFGVAAGLHRELETAHGILRGTFPYMSPEQTLCRPLDGRSDIFSLGICLYEALTARHPFAEDEDYLTIKNIQELSPPPPDHHRGDIDSALSAIVMRCMEKDPEDRYASAQALQDDLGAWLRAKRATYGAGRLSRLMADCFPSPEPSGSVHGPPMITLGPTSPGSSHPLLDLSLLDKRGRRRVGGAIKPRDPVDETWPAEVEADEAPQDDTGGGLQGAEDDQEAEFGERITDPDELPVIRGRSQDWGLSQRGAPAQLSRGLDDLPATRHPHGPVSMDRMQRATSRPGKRPSQLGWVAWVVSIAVLCAIVVFAFQQL